MIKINKLKISAVALFWASLQVIFAADITMTSEPTTNSAGNNGKLTISTDPLPVNSPFTISLVGPVPYSYNYNAAGFNTTLSNLRFGKYSGTVVDNEGCMAFVEGFIKKCKFVPTIGGGDPSVICELTSEPHPGGVDLFYTTGNVNSYSGTEPTNFTFQAYHSLPSYLFDQITPLIYQTMTNEIVSLEQFDFSTFEIFEQFEFQSDEPYIFSFNADGSIIWVFRNINAEKYIPAIERIGEEVGWHNNKLYPNPTSGIVNVPFENQGEVDNGSYVVMNSIGQIVFTGDYAVGELSDVFYH